MTESAPRTVGVVGAGIMGTGLAENLSESGHNVILVDTSQEALDRVRGAVAQSLKMRKLFHRQSGLPSADELMTRIGTTTDYKALRDASFVIENVVEDVGVKEKVYRELDLVCAQDVPFAVNTSAIPIGKVASWTRRPERVLGIHFMNPVPLKDTVEVIRSKSTSEQTLQEALELLASMGKSAVVVNDAPGFVSNRILMLTVNEAVGVVEEGVSNPSDVDKIFKLCFGHKMGPLETADLIGLDTILNTLIVLRDELGDLKFEPKDLLKKKVADGHLGRKTGRGFHDYGSGA